MFRRSLKVLLISLCMACDRGRPAASASVASSTPIVARQRVDSAQPTPPKVERAGAATGGEMDAVETDAVDAESVDSDAADSTDFEWTFAPRNGGSNTRFAGRVIRRPNGLLKIWFDTATRATEEKPAGRTGVDSVIVRDLRHGDWFTIVCNSGAGTRDTQLVGVVHNDRRYVHPRLVWQLDTATNRIKSVSPEGIFCTAASEEGD